MNFSLRPWAEPDLPFLAELYASTRESEMQLVPWSDAEKKHFLQQQFQAQHQFYQDQFPDAQFDIIQHQSTPVGRLYVSRTAAEIRIIDIALLPAYRGQGLGTQLMRSLLDEASSTWRPVRIHVETFNPARRLYQRLGFRELEDKGVYVLLEWKAEKADAGGR